MATLKSVLFLLIVFVALVQCGQEADDSVEIGSPRGHSNRFVRNAGGKREGKTEVEVEKLTLRELPVQKGGLSSPSKLRKLKGQEEDDVLNVCMNGNIVLLN